jgi:alpha/beta hydrolase family protein
VRLYMVSGTQHGGGNGVGTETLPTACQNPSSAVIMRPTDRAMIIAMEAWLTTGADPPASRYPTLGAGTLAPPARRTQVGFLDSGVVGFAYAGAYNPLFVTDYSDAIPAVNLAKAYQLLVPTTDADGNDIPGIRVPDVSVPIATYTGWNFRKAGFSQGDTCGSSGSTISFPATVADRIAKKDPRRSLAERYTSKAVYVSTVQAAAQALVDQRLLLSEDVSVFVNAAEKVSVASRESADKIVK